MNPITEPSSAPSEASASLSRRTRRKGGDPDKIASLNKDYLEKLRKLGQFFEESDPIACATKALKSHGFVIIYDKSENMYRLFTERLLRLRDIVYPCALDRQSLFEKKVAEFLSMEKMLLESGAKQLDEKGEKKKGIET